VCLRDMKALLTKKIRNCVGEKPVALSQTLVGKVLDSGKEKAMIPRKSSILSSPHAHVLGRRISLLTTDVDDPNHVVKSLSFVLPPSYLSLSLSLPFLQQPPEADAHPWKNHLPHPNPSSCCLPPVRTLLLCGVFERLKTNGHTAPYAPPQQFPLLRLLPFMLWQLSPTTNYDSGPV